MYSIIILQEFRSALMRDTFLNRNNIVIRAAGSNDELLQFHRTDPAGLIVTRLDARGMSGEQLCMSIREDKTLRNVSVIMVCPDTEEGRAAAARCRANEVLTMPLDTGLLAVMALQLLQVPVRKSYRVLLNVSVQGRDQASSFVCRSENISATGLLIETDRYLRAGDRISCTFSLGSREVTVCGEIVRVIPPPLDSNLNRYGIKFRELSDAARTAIEAFSAAALPSPGS